MAITLDSLQEDLHSISIKDSTNGYELLIDSSGHITANINGTVTVSATDLDIRDLSASQDNVAISDGTDTLAVNADGSINSVVTATDLDIRDITHVSDSIKVGDGTDFLAIAADGSIAVTDNGGSLTVDATDLDIRDLSAAQDNVAIRDAGGDELAINADGSLNVNTFEGGYSTWQYSDQDVTSTASQLAATALANRLRMVIQNLGSSDIYIGDDNSVTVATGLKIPKGSSMEMAWDAGATIWALTSSGTSDIRIAEFAA